MLHKFTCVLVNSQLGSRQGQLGKTAVTKTGTYIVPMDRKTTEYGLEAGRIVLFFFQKKHIRTNCAPVFRWPACEFEVNNVFIVAEPGFIIQYHTVQAPCDTV